MTRPTWVVDGVDPPNKPNVDTLACLSVSLKPEKAKATNIVRGSSLLPDLHFDADIFDEVLSGGLIDIRPSGSAEVLFGGNWQRNENPNFSARQQRTGNFDFKLKMQFCT